MPGLLPAPGPGFPGNLILTPRKPHFTPRISHNKGLFCPGNLTGVPKSFIVAGSSRLIQKGNSPLNFRIFRIKELRKNTFTLWINPITWQCLAETDGSHIKSVQMPGQPANVLSPSNQPLGDGKRLADLSIGAEDGVRKKGARQGEPLSQSTSNLNGRAGGASPRVARTFPPIDPCDHAALRPHWPYKSPANSGDS